MNQNTLPPKDLIKIKRLKKKYKGKEPYKYSSNAQERKDFEWLYMGNPFLARIREYKSK